MSTRPSATHYDSSSSSVSVSSSSYSSSDSDLSLRTSMDAQPVASVEVLRCLRCHRHVETTSTDDLASTGMIRIGTNLYYCQRCRETRSSMMFYTANAILITDESHTTDQHSLSRKEAAGNPHSQFRTCGSNETPAVACAKDDIDNTLQQQQH
ncbi:hypothetical protein F5B20DRAFT_584034 [Whalleya microplaca]|nr:hypothetical protein F5B20DRAFT_584034 [Whalleya microplaca]